MDMAARFQDQLVFHMTGKRAGDGLTALDPAKLRPALFAGYRDLTRLRYDYPVVLLDRDDAEDYARPLSVVVNELLAELAPPGIEGERLRKHVLQLERDIRVQVAGGAAGNLSDLWNAATERLCANADDARADVLARAAASLKVDGAVVDCNAALPSLFLARAWDHVRARKAADFRRLVDQLIRQLSDILRAAFVHSQAGQQPTALQASFGALHSDVFDFGAMSRLVIRRAPVDDLPPARRTRIEWALGVLRSQPFYPDPRQPPGAAEAYEFSFESCAAAIAAYRARLPWLAEVVKAIAVAELEARGAYLEEKHDAFFDRYDEQSLTADDIAQFPDYLVCIPSDRNDAPENAALLEMLSSGLPVKVLVELSDLIDEASIGTGHFAFGVRGARLATTAMGLGGMFVLQTASSNLCALRQSVLRGMQCRGPALFTVYGGEAAGGLPRYLSAAAAMESRAFPAFTYDANAGTNWATRFSLEDNRDAEADWPAEDFEYADEALQRVSERVSFTYADFALCDRRHAHHFAVVPRDRWSAAMLPVAEWLALPERTASERVPYVLAVDDGDRLHRVIVDNRLMQATHRCLLLWHRLQEHGGIHNSHAEQALARDRQARVTERRDDEAAPEAAPPAQPAAAPAVATAEDAAARPPSDEPWIETTRCSSCNECRNINDKLFGYNENKQAYIKDVSAGTYRQIVEAAEACQVAIIHPGKPKNPNEPGLEELLERAKPFL